jgi:hypothetical protein
VIAEVGFHLTTDASVQLALRGWRERRQRRLLQQAVAERALEIGEPPDLADDLGTQERRDVAVGVGAARDRGHDRDGELTTDHGRHLGEPPGAGFESVDPCDEERLEGGRELRGGARRDGPRPSAVAARLEQGAQQLLHIQRVAFGLGDDLVLHRLTDQTGRNERVDQRPRRPGCERRQGHLLHPVGEPRLRGETEGPPLRTRIGT